jgi:FkbM family methyltransferase
LSLRRVREKPVAVELAKDEIPSLILLFLDDIRKGYRLRDKMVIAVHFFLMPIHLLGKCLGIRGPTYRFYLWDFVARNSYGLFFCRNRTLDFIAVKDSYEQELSRYFDSVRSGVFIDIGSHIGRYTVKVARQLGDDGKVVSVEPEAGNFHSLLRNISINGLHNVVPLNVACWSANSKKRLYLADDRADTLAHSLLVTGKRFAVVRARRLDDILQELKIKSVDFIKIDAEGAESEILVGAERVLEENKNLQILFEAHHEADLNKVANVLKRFNYEIQKVSNIYFLARRM